MNIRFYLDENVDVSLAKALADRDVGVITTQQAGNKGQSDPDQLIYTAANKKAIITHDTEDYVPLGKPFLKRIARIMELLSLIYCQLERC